MTLKKMYKSIFTDDKRKIALFLLGLLALNIFLYIGCLQYNFLKDDYRLILENPRIKDFDAFISAIGSKFFSFPDYPYLHYWRPISLFSFFLDYQLWGVNPSGYHLTNIILNVLTVILLFFIFYAVTGKSMFSFLATLFFSVHPSHVEAVAWISGRTDLLGALYIFAAILLFIQFLKKKKGYFYVGTIIFFLLALLSKENAVLFPLFAAGLVFFISEYVTGVREKVRECFRLTIPFWLFDIIYILIHSHFSGVEGILKDFSFTDIVVIFKTIGAYVKTILLPFFPAPYFSMNQFDASTLEYLLYFGVGLAALSLIIVKRKHYRYSLFSLMFFIFLLPVLDPELVPSYPRIVIRFAFIPAAIAGVFYLETFYLFRILSFKPVIRKTFAGFLVLLALVWSFQSYMFQEYFRDQYSHYNGEDGLSHHFPNDCSLLLPLALQKAKRGEFYSALVTVEHALEVNWKDPWVDISVMGGLLKANLLVITGKGEEGKTLAMSIMEETDRNEMKYFGYLILSKYHDKRGEFPEALSMLNNALKLGETADLLFRMALIYGKMEQFESSLKKIRKAIRLNPIAVKYRKFERFLLEHLKQNDIKGNMRQQYSR
jgi:tetratricopeptide (TPR) repeat protein